MVEVPERYADRIERRAVTPLASYQGLHGDALRAAIARDIRGVLMAQYLPPDSEAFGNELIVGIRRTREFGMVISAGVGGTDTELYAERFRKGQAVVAASTAMTDGESFFELFRGTVDLPQDRRPDARPAAHRDRRAAHRVLRLVHRHGQPLFRRPTPGALRDRGA